MATQALFPTLVYAAPLHKRGAEPFNQRLLHECRQLRVDDVAGRTWSRTNYPGGYTSYGSQHRLYEISPTFATLRKLLKPHVQAFAREVEWDLRGRTLAMTDCWVNIMPHRTVHSPASASTVDREWHLLRADSIGQPGYQVRRPAAGSIHGSPATQEFL